MGSHVKVAVRVKPVKSEVPSDYLMTIMDPPTLILKRTGKAGEALDGMYQFVYTNILEDCSNKEIYDDVAKSVVESVMDGFNGTIMAYGQTGSGKTYTMLGPDNVPFTDPVGQGVIPRSLQSLFYDIRKKPDIAHSQVYVSYFEVYNEQFYDLLNINTKANTIAVKEDPKTKAISLSNITPTRADSIHEVFKLINDAQKHRKVASHNLNDRSSRSHTILSVMLETVTTDGTTRCGKLNLVDLAGSERAKRTMAVGKVAEEGKQINLSLLTLRNVVQALATKSSHVPYRDAKLTNVLKDSLGGNCKTTLIACIWGDEEQAGETVTTCKFAESMMKVEVTAKVNVNGLETNGNVMNLSPQVKKIMEQMIQARLAKERMMDRGFGGDPELMEANRLEIERFRDEQQALLDQLDQVKRAEAAKIKEVENEVEKVRRELEEQRRINEAHEAGKGESEAKFSDEVERLKAQLAQALDRQASVNEELHPAHSTVKDSIKEEEVDEFKVFQEMKRLGAQQKVLRAKMAAGTITAAEADEELYLRDQLYTLQCQNDVLMSPRKSREVDTSAYGGFADNDSIDLTSDSAPSPHNSGGVASSPSFMVDSEGTTDSPTIPAQAGNARDWGRQQSASSAVFGRNDSIRSSGTSVWNDDSLDPNFVPDDVKSPTLMKQMKRLLSGRKSTGGGGGSTLTASNMSAHLAAQNNKAQDTIVILNGLNHSQLLEELNFDGRDYSELPLDLDALSAHVPRLPPAAAK